MARGIVFVLLFVFSLGTVEAKSGSFLILKPDTNGVYDENYASLVIKRLDKSLEKISLVLQDDIIIDVQTNQKDRDVYCKTINLKLGNNKVTIIGYGGDKELTRKEINLFYRSEIYGDFDEEPSGYKRNFFHLYKNEKLCMSCHNMKPDKKSLKKKHISPSKINAKDFDVLANPEDSNCYQCHKTIVYRKNGHAPSVNFLCTECHTGKSGEFNLQDEGKSKYLMPDPIMNRCFSCHEGVKEKWFSNTSEHGPLRSGRCNKCHNPHSSAYEFHLRKPIWDLCTTCHAEKATGKHVIGSFVFGRNRGSHPTRGRDDPSRPGRKLVCSSCHNPHGSNGIYLLRAKGKTAFSVCQRCHKK